MVDVAHKIGCSAPRLPLPEFGSSLLDIFPIIGARTLEHLKNNLGCLQVALSEEQFMRLNAASEVDPGFALKFLRRLQNLFVGAANETLDLSLHSVSRLVLDRK